MTPPDLFSFSYDTSQPVRLPSPQRSSDLTDAQQRLHRYVTAHYNGVTAADIQSAMGISAQACAVQISELTRIGRIVDSGERYVAVRS